MEEGNIFYKSISEATPMMSQYLAAKSECPDCLLLFRLGDFYECFFEDAKLASSILNIVLTKRGKSEGEDIPMCGIPVATIDNYVGKLIKSGQKVAICEQLESPLDAKKRGYKAIVKREVTRIISAGTLVEDNLLTSKENNYLMSVVPVCKRKKDQIDDVSFSLIDISTGAFFVNTVPAQKINSIFETYRPKEVLISEDFKDTFKDVPKIITTTITTLPHSKFNPQIEKERLEKYFKVKTLDSFGLNSDSELASCGSIIEYLIITQKNNLSTLPIPKKITMNDYLLIDASTNKSLDILSSVHEDRNHCLLGALDRTVTAFGARLLVERIAMPIVNVEHIKRRQQCVEFFIKNKKDTENLRELLQQCPDFERAINRIRFNKFSPRDVETIRDAIRIAVTVWQYFQNINDKNIPSEDASDKVNDLVDFSELDSLLQKSLVQKYTANGPLIAEGFSEDLDKLRYLKNHSEELMQKLQDKYIYQTGINTLKIRSNAIIGWYIEIPASQKSKVLPSFIHRQTLVNNIRYYTDEIFQLQMDLEKSVDKCNQLEQQIYNDIVQRIMEKYEDISRTVRQLSLLDVYTNFATIATERNYICPEVVDEPILQVTSGRHPVLELSHQNFVKNDCDLTEDSRICLLTGPNMAGKSTYLRQNALLIVMAQAGSYIPAASARIGVVDRLFSRIGASDDIALGRSTFMVEMIETATILNQATEKSFVILDEVGRGTSTYDGLSIAWSVIESLYHNNKCRVLFATHYHELTSLKDSLTNIKCKTLKVQESDGKVVFYHKIIDGIADKSYGIHVASLAGVPASVISRARQLLKQFESKKNSVTVLYEPSEQMKLAYKSESEVESRLKKIDINCITPLQALNILQELKSMQ